MTLATLKIGRREFVVVPRRDFERLQRKADQMEHQDALDAAESTRRLSDPSEKRIPWDQVKRRAGLA
jgi:hypothetical protein